MRKKRQKLKRDSFEKHEIGYESSGVMYGVKISEKNNLEEIYYVLLDLQLHEFELLLWHITELKIYGIQHFEIMRKIRNRMKKNQRKKSPFEKQNGENS